MLVNQIRNIVNDTIPRERKALKISKLLTKVNYKRECDIVPSIYEPNVYYAFIDNRECKFTKYGNIIISDSLTEEEKEFIIANIN